MRLYVLNIALITTLILFNVSRSFAYNPDKNKANNTTVIQGTHLALANSAYDVLKQIPGVTINSKDIPIVNGTYTAVIYLNNRKVNDIQELRQLYANNVKDISVITNPDSKYSGEYQAVILVRTIREDSIGYRIYDQLQLSYNGHMGVENNLLVSVVRKKLTLSGDFYYGYSNSDYTIEEFYETFTTPQGGSSLVLDTRDYYNIHRFLKVREVSTKVAAEYRISAEHAITFSYNYYTRGKYRKENNPQINKFYSRGNNPTIDLVNPVKTNSIYSLDNRPIQRHSLHFGYEGKHKGWLFYANADFYHNFEGQYVTNNIIDNPTDITKNLLFEQSQQYFNIKGLAKHNLGKGELELGGELNFTGHTNLYDDYIVNNDRIHARIKDYTQGIFANITYPTKWFGLKAGIRYDSRTNSYNPYKDDQTRDQLIDSLSVYNIGNSLNHNYVTGNISLFKTFGDIKANLSYNVSYIKPFKKFQRISSDDLDNLKNMLLRSEFQHSVLLETSWKWLRFNVFYTHYKDPIFETMSSLENYNGPDYNSLGLQAIASSKFGWWTPNLSLYLHKQWLNMPTVDGTNNLNKPRLITMFANTFSLPYGITLNLIANWETKGAKRSTFNYTQYFNLDASLYKEFINGKLSVMLSGENILGTACSDATKYTLPTDGECGGEKIYHPSYLSVSIKLKL